MEVTLRSPAHGTGPSSSPRPQKKSSKRKHSPGPNSSFLPRMRELWKTRPGLLFPGSRPDFVASGCFLFRLATRRRSGAPVAEAITQLGSDSHHLFLSAASSALVSSALGGGVLWVSLSPLILKYRRANGASARRPAHVWPFPLLLASFFITSQLRIYSMSGLLSLARRVEVRGRYFKDEVEGSARRLGLTRV